MAAESREAPAADVWGSNTIHPSVSFSSNSILVSREEFRGPQNNFGECSSGNADETMGFRRRSVVHSIFRHVDVAFILFVKAPRAENEACDIAVLHKIKEIASMEFKIYDLEQ